jgi:hypothetical protein
MVVNLVVKKSKQQPIPDPLFIAGCRSLLAKLATTNTNTTPPQLEPADYQVLGSLAEIWLAGHAYSPHLLQMLGCSRIEMARLTCLLKQEFAHNQLYSTPASANRQEYLHGS